VPETYPGPNGRGSHATVTAGLALLRRDAIPFTLVAVVRPDNAGRLKILTHLYDGLPCPARCSLAGEAVAVAPSGRLYPCAQMIAEDRGETLVIGTALAGLDRNKLAELRRQKDRIEAACADCALASRCQSHCGCRHWALTGELGRSNAILCELEESFITAADRAAATLMAEGCASFVATYYRQRYTRSIRSTVTRVEPAGRR